jgi:hypothetical protein
MPRVEPTPVTSAIVLALVPLFALIAVHWGIGSALLLTPSVALVARSLLVAAPAMLRP